MASDAADRLGYHQPADRRGGDGRVVRRWLLVLVGTSLRVVRAVSLPPAILDHPRALAQRNCPARPALDRSTG